MLVLFGMLCAGDPPVRVEQPPDNGKPTPTKAVAKKLSAMDLVAEDEKWIFTTTPGRPDIFVDQELLLILQKGSVDPDQPGIRSPGVRHVDDANSEANMDKLLTWAQREEESVRQFVTARRYDDAIRSSDAALKQLEPNMSRADLAAIVASIRIYRDQSIEAKIRDDAQTAFDNLKIRVQGVLWSQEGVRLAIIEGETAAKPVNDRIRSDKDKECVIIDIGQDRVVFRFNFQRRRFEFPVYVDQLNARTKP
ncbi:MAG: hypothetical protein AAB263_04940 [Planctomycetota bacterium]